MSSTSPFWVLQTTRPTSTPSVWVSQRSTPWCPKSSKMPRQPQLFGREEMEIFLWEMILRSPEFRSLFSTNPGCFMLQKAGFQSGAANIPAPRTSWTSLCRQQETQNDQTPWQPGLGILGKSIASSQTQGIFRQFHGIKIGNLEEWLFLSVWYSPQLLSRGCVLLALRLDAEVPTSAPWGIAPSQVVSHWQSLGRRFLGF